MVKVFDPTIRNTLTLSETRKGRGGETYMRHKISDGGAAMGRRVIKIPKREDEGGGEVSFIKDISQDD